MGYCALLTSMGGLVSPGIIENVRSMSEITRIIGVNASDNAIGFHFVDKSFVVPPGDAENYVSALTEIVVNEAVDIIIPCSDEEVVTLSQAQKFLERHGARILCSPWEVTSSAIDKGSMLLFLQKHGVTVPAFFLPTTKDELVTAAGNLGYPKKAVVAKPRRGRGGRGFKLLKQDIDVFETRDSTIMKLEWYVEAMSEADVSRIVIMEHLSGEDYSVDALAYQEKTIAVVPRKRISAIRGPSQVGETDMNPQVIAMVETIIETFGFQSNVNVQLKYRESEHIPLVYEINPRISGTIAANRAAGVDLLAGGIRQALGLSPIEYDPPRAIKMIRYLKEFYLPAYKSGTGRKKGWL